MVAEYASLLTSAVLMVVRPCVVVGESRPGEAAGTSLAYRTLSTGGLTRGKARVKSGRPFVRSAGSAANRPPSVRGIHPAKR